MDKVEQELTNALAQGRQPICIYCRAPLEVVYPVFHSWVEFVWDKDKKRYKKIKWSGGVQKPKCKRCESKDWDFVGQNEAAIKLGLAYFRQRL
jgi:hypothetical protein